MWRLAEVHCSFQLWFSDGKPIEALRGGGGVSSRLIVDHQGFLDLTEISLSKMTVLDANGSMLWLRPDPERRSFPSSGNTPQWLELSLEIVGDGGFELSLIRFPTVGAGMVTSVLHSPCSGLLECRILHSNRKRVRKTQAIARSIRQRCQLHQ